MKNQALLLCNEIHLWNDPCARAAAELRRLHEENKLLHERHSLDNKEVVRLHEANQAMLSALKDARNQLESYELELNGDSYNDLTINAAIAKGEQQ